MRNRLAYLGHVTSRLRWPTCYWVIRWIVRLFYWATGTHEKQKMGLFRAHVSQLYMTVGVKHFTGGA